MMQTLMDRDPMEALRRAAVDVMEEPPPEITDSDLAWIESAREAEGDDDDT